MNDFISSFLRRLIRSRVETSIDLWKIKAAIAYLNLVKGTRRLFILLCLLVFGVVILACGFIMIPIALCLFMPWSQETKAIVAICFGAAYIILPLLLMLILFSERLWMKLSRADELLRRVLKN